MTRRGNTTAPLIAPGAEERYGRYIREALITEGGHLAIGRGGFTLYFARGAYLSGHGRETVKTACIAAGLPVIDSGDQAVVAIWSTRRSTKERRVTASRSSVGLSMVHSPKKRRQSI